MAKNILIFSDGTGQAGGLLPDEARSNIYKLYRATRCGPDSPIDPAQQLAFYDPGLGSQTDGGRLKFGWTRWARNFLSQATGLGITQNVIDCYAAIIALWEPGDRIYLFGFSRGAYTVRCLCGVLTLCGVPTRMKDGSTMNLHPDSVRAIATEAVKDVYQYGVSIEGDPFLDRRLERALQFRKAYGSEDGNYSNGSPYFVGTFDTVAALGAPAGVRYWLTGLLGVAAVALVATAVYAISSTPLMTTAITLAVLAAILGALYAWNFLYYHPGKRRVFRSAWLMTFYDFNLDRRVGYARHALSIDEARRDFDRVKWKYTGDARTREPGAPPLLKQIWFAGNHSDIGGSYSENESRLSDISLQWMWEQLKELEHPVHINEAVFKLYPSATGPQHDECKMGLPGIWRMLGLKWANQPRTIKTTAPLHPTVIERFKAPKVLNFDVMEPYRPPALKDHELVKQYYSD